VARDQDGQTAAESKTKAQQADQANFDKMEQDLRQQIAQNPKLENLQGQVQITREKEGVRIEIIDKADFAMFGLGNTQLQSRAQGLIDEIASSLTGMPNKISVRGHTDSLPFANPAGRNNWSLSAERAEATRAMLEKRGIKSDRFVQIEGVADTAPYNTNDPKDPRNRRISITVKFREGE
ncbi:MAG: OmpA/MotB family protein, partial [Rhodoferax sp.]